jgi:hypothetical protein
MLPARAMFNSPQPGNLHTKIERLLPAICKLLLQEHTTYLQEGCLPIPETMKEHKDLLTRSTAAHAFATAHVQVINKWLSQVILHVPGAKLASSAVTDRFISCNTQSALAVQRYYQNRGMAPCLHSLVDSLLDSCLALTGIAKHDGAYLNVMLPL